MKAKYFLIGSLLAALLSGCGVDEVELVRQQASLAQAEAIQAQASANEAQAQAVQVQAEASARIVEAQVQVMLVQAQAEAEAVRALAQANVELVAAQVAQVQANTILIMAGVVGVVVLAGVALALLVLVIWSVRKRETRPVYLPHSSLQALGPGQSLIVWPTGNRELVTSETVERGRR